MPVRRCPFADLPRRVKHSHCRTDKVYLPDDCLVAVCSGTWATPRRRSAAALTQSYGSVSMRCLTAGAVRSGSKGFSPMASTARPKVCGPCSLGHASGTACATLLKLPKKLAAITSPLRKALRTQFHTLWYRARQRTGLRVFTLGQRLRHFVDHVTATAGPANGERARRWVQDKKAGWYAVLARPADARRRAPCSIRPITPSSGS